MLTSNETLIRIIAAGLRARDSLPEGEWTLHRQDGDIPEIYVRAEDGSIADHVAACSTHELDDFLMTVRPQVAVDLARDLLQIRGVAGMLVDLLPGAAMTADDETNAKIVSLRDTLRAMVGEVVEVRAAAEPADGVGAVPCP